MATILTKKSDTASSVPSAAQLTNSATGAELAVNTADKRLYTKDSGGNIVELGTNPTSLTTTGSVTSAGASNSGNLNFTGTGNRITGDFSNATATNRVMFQTSTANSSTDLAILPNGTSVVSAVRVKNSSDPANSSDMVMFVSGSEARLYSLANGTGSYLPMTFYTGGSERVRIDTSGNVGIGTSSPAGRLDVRGGSGASGVQAYFSPDAGYAAPAAANASFSGGTRQVLWNDTVTPQKLSIGMDANATMWFANLGAQGGGASTSGGFNWYTSQSAGGTPNVSMRIDSSGNVGIGTSSPGAKLDVAAITAIVQIDSSSGTAGASVTRYKASNRTWVTGVNVTDPTGAYTVYDVTASAERMRIDSSGNVGIGTSSPSYRLHVVSATENGAFVSDGTRSFSIINSSAAGGPVIGAYSNHPLLITTNNTERARIDTSGNLMVGTTSADGKFVAATVSTTQRSVHASSSSGSSTTDGVYYAYVAQARGTGFNFMRFQNTSAIDFQVLGNGNVQNTNNSYGAISDVKLKENIVDATPKLEKLKQVRVVNYNFKGSDQKQLGVIAQEIEQIFPGMVEETPDRDTEGNHLGTTTKSVKYSVFVPMLIKAMQEQQAQIEQLRAEIKTLKGN